MEEAHRQAVLTPAPALPDDSPTDEALWAALPDAVADSGEAAGEPPATARPGAAAGTPGDHAQAALLYRVMNQDADALAALYAQLSGLVYALVLRITRQVALAEEVLEDVFWQVWRQAPRFDPARGSVRAWVMVMARSRALDALRARRADPLAAPAPLHDGEADDPLDSTPAPDPQDLLLAAQGHATLHLALKRLDPLLRQLVALCYFRGLTQQEVAEHTGLPLGTVKTHLRRSLALLRAALAVPGDQPAGDPAL